MAFQNATGFFNRFKKGGALCKIPFYDSFNKIFNILETIQGLNGIKILKPQDNEGKGWAITLDYSEVEQPIETPQLFDGKFDEDGNLSVYVGTSNTPIVRIPYSGSGGGYTDYLLSTYPADGWLSVVGSNCFVYVYFDPSSTSYPTIVTDATGSVVDFKFAVPIGYSKWVSGSDPEWQKYQSSTVILPVFGDTTFKDLSTFAVHQSIEHRSVNAGASSIDTLQLHKFDSPDANAIIHAGDSTFSTDKALQKIAVRKEDSNGKAELIFCSHNPAPAGDGTNVALKWNNTLGGWQKALLIDTSDDEQSTEITTGDRVVIGAQTSATDGRLIQLITAPLGDMGGLTTEDLTQITVVTACRYDTTSKQIQIKTRTGYVYSPGTESDWTMVTGGQAEAFNA